MNRGSLQKIPDSLEFFPHQIEGVRWLAKRTSAILADEMGLGKSLQVLSVGAVAFEQKQTERLLIVSPASLKENWAEEIEEHTNFSWEILDGDRPRRKKTLSSFSADILITNYEQIASGHKLVTEKIGKRKRKVLKIDEQAEHVSTLNQMNFGMTIYDEAHMIKNKDSVRTRGCQRLLQLRHFLLTGSPLLNQVDDLWTLLNRIDPAAFPNYWSFINRYAVFGGYQDKQIVGMKNEVELREKLQTRMLRREKKDVLDLPNKQDIVVKVDLTPLQRELYEQAKDELLVNAPALENGELIIANAMTKMLRLKQICGTAATIPGQPDESGKLDMATEKAAELIENDHPLVAFTQFRDVMESYRTRLMAEGVDVRVLHGDIPAADRVPIVRAWSTDAKNGRPQVLLCMFQVAGVGLNMTAARHMFYLDKLWVPKLNEQAEDRLHRIGADKVQPIQIYHFFCRNSIDTRINNVLKNKSDIFDTVVSTDNSDWKKKLIAAVMAEEEG